MWLVMDAADMQETLEMHVQMNSLQAQALEHSEKECEKLRRTHKTVRDRVLGWMLQLRERVLQLKTQVSLMHTL